MNTNTQPVESPKTVLLEFENDADLFFYAYSLISVCETASDFHSENRMTHLNDHQHEVVAGSSMMNISKALSLTKKLLYGYL